VFFLINSSVEFLLYTLFAIPTINIAIALLSKESKQFINVANAILAFLLFMSILGLCTSYKSINHISFTLAELFEIDLNFKVEPIGLFFALIVSFLWFLNSIFFAGGFTKNHLSNKENSFFITFNAKSIIFALLFAFSANLFTTFIFYELLLLITLLLIKKGTTSSKKNYKYLIISFSISAIILLFTIIYIYHFTGTANYSPSGITNLYFSSKIIVILFMIFFLSIAASTYISIYLRSTLYALQSTTANLHILIIVMCGIIFLAKIIFYIFGISSN
jgi:multicomponent Na+:H+ antiporter subunit D